MGKKKDIRIQQDCHMRSADDAKKVMDDDLNRALHDGRYTNV